MPDRLSVSVFHKTAGFRHESIPAGIDAITRIGENQGFDVAVSDDASVFTETLTEHDVIVFLNTTGDILAAPQQQATEGFIRSGRGFVGVHSAADTEYEWSWYGGLLGAYFDSHPSPQPATVNFTDPDHPATRGLESSVERFDEWYNFRSRPDPDVKVLATLDESSYDGGTMGEDHPIVWAQEYEGGRSFYTGFGHTIESFSEPLMIDLLTNAIRWAGDSPPS